MVEKRHKMFNFCQKNYLFQKISLPLSLSGSEGGFLSVCFYYRFVSYLARYRKVTICPRVQSFIGWNVVSLVPVVIFCSTAHSTALA